MTFSQLIFDLDGTLTDPLPGMVASINHALESCGFAPRHAGTLAQYVGPPLEGTFSILADTSDDELITQLIVHYRERYLDTGFAQNAVYDGITELLDSLTDAGHVLGVCTSKPATTAVKILELFGLSSYFQFVSGGDVGIIKSQQLNQLLSAGTIDTSALMIGDRSVDISAAKSNRLRSAAVSWGYGSEQELGDASPDLFLSRPSSLLGYLTGQPGIGTAT